MNTQRISLDISKIIDVPPVVRIGQGDSAGTTIVARVFDNGTSTNLDGMGARFCMRLPDGTHYGRDSDCTVSGNTVTYVVDESHCAAVRGRTDDVYFDILADGEVIYSTSRFSVHVLRGVTDGAVPGETYDDKIEEAVQRAYEAAEAAEEAAGGVTPLMSESTLGGAKLGDGLTITSEKLGVSPITTSQIDTIANDGSVNSTNVLNGTRLTYLWGKIKAKFAAVTHSHAASDITSGTLATDRIPSLSTDKLTSGTLPVARGGTGSVTHISNAVLTGNVTGAVKNVSTKSGALYATATNGAAKFDTLPIAQGGTGATTAADAVANIVDGQDIEPASVAATGDVTSGNGVHNLSDKANSAALAKVESTTATTVTPVGGIFMLDGVLRKATDAIAVGETINDSNSTVTTMNDKIDGVWNNCLHFRGTISDSTSRDYNGYTDIGYLYVTTTSSTNAPEADAQLGMLFAFPSTYLTWQVCYSAMTAKIYHRHRNSAGTWSAWRQLS